MNKQHEITIHYEHTLKQVTTPREGISNIADNMNMLIELYEYQFRVSYKEKEAWLGGFAIDPFGMPNNTSVDMNLIYVTIADEESGEPELETIDEAAFLDVVRQIMSQADLHDVLEQPSTHTAHK